MLFPNTRLTCGMMTMAVLTYVMLREQCGNQDGTWGLRWLKTKGQLWIAIGLGKMDEDGVMMCDVYILLYGYV